ncbi:MAG TPA: CAP domain-containing protein [Actinomycetota bacterium]|jgi:Cysteine-rich secretory protein family|nr:CAP domain-containing protein [Actinomycetota bacterium]
MPVHRVLILLLLAIGVFFTPMIGQQPAVAGPRTDAARGLPRMKVSATLGRLAYRHSVAMARKGRLWHNDISSATDHWVWLGQNVGVGSSVEGLQRAFMDSPPHRANILRRKTNLFGSEPTSVTAGSGSRSTSSRPPPAGRRLGTL